MGQTGRNLKHQIGEHRYRLYSLTSGNTEVSAVTEHSVDTGHTINLEEAEVIDTHPGLHLRCVLEWYNYVSNVSPMLQGTRTVATCIPPTGPVEATRGKYYLAFIVMLFLWLVTVDCCTCPVHLPLKKTAVRQPKRLANFWLVLQLQDLWCDSLW